MRKSTIELPSKITEDSWFYKEHKEVLEKHLGKFYVSYSTISSWCDYRADFVKEKLVGIKLPDSIYAAFGTWVGTSVEVGVEQVNNYGFLGGGNIKKIERTAKDTYERLVIIDRGAYLVLGFIDILRDLGKNYVDVIDIKTGGSKKEEEYKKDGYIQTVLYAKALEDEGLQVKNTGVIFCRRKGSHINPPLSLSDEQFYIPLDYNSTRVKYALNKIDKAVSEISDIYKCYNKFFKI